MPKLLAAMAKTSGRFLPVDQHLITDMLKGDFPCALALSCGIGAFFETFTPIIVYIKFKALCTNVFFCPCVCVCVCGEEYIP